jgi:hypothetical protein
MAVLISTCLFAQEKPQASPEPPQTSGEQKNAEAKSHATLVSPSARLAAAKTAYMKNAAGSEIPFNVISAGIDGWGRFQMVGSPSEADVVIEVYSPDDEHASSSSTSAKTKVGAGRMSEPAAASSSNTDGPIRLVVSDPRTHLALWTATEQPKGAFRQRAHDEHIIEAAQRLLAKFHDRLEPPPPAAK